MRVRAVVCVAAVALAAGAAMGLTATGTANQDTGKTAETAKAQQQFEIADIHPSPPRTFPFFQEGFLEDGRYVLRQATMGDLIATAYGLRDSSYVHGGPPWLDWDRYDVIGKVPDGTNLATAKEMLKSLLEKRFKLVAHEGEAEMPAYWMTLAPGGLKVKATPNGTGDGQCHGSPTTTAPEPGSVPLETLSCTNKSMAALADTLTRNHGGQYLRYPVVDKTGAKGAYDFDLKYTPMYSLSQAGTAGVTIFAAMEKQLGVKLELKTMPEQGLVVDSVEETPTPNRQDLAKLMPAMAPAEFEVAVIKPSASDERPNFRITGDEVVARAVPLKLIMDFAWDVSFAANDAIVGAPKWLDSDKIDLEAKVAASNLSDNGGRGPSVAIEDLREMLQALLIQRFEIKAQMEDRPVDTYALIAVDPKMQKADPAARTECKEGPGPDGKDPRLTHPVLNRLVTCTDMTTAEMVDEFQRIANGYIYYPVEDKTGLKGRWDFTLSFSSVNLTRERGHSDVPSETGGTAAAAPDPNGAVTFYDAVSKELGLKLVKEQRPEPVLVIEHMDEQPTAN